MVGLNRRWKSWKEKVLGKARSEGCPENDTVAL